MTKHAAHAYELDLSPVSVPAGRPVIFFSSGTPSTAELDAARTMLGCFAADWRIVLPEAVAAPPEIAHRLVGFGADRQHNALLMRRAAKGFGRDYHALFVFLPGRRRRWPRVGFARAARKAGLSRFASALDARLVPVWFSGARKGLVSSVPRCRVGTPILAQELAFFGSKLADGLRASAASLKGHVTPLVQTPRRLVGNLIHGPVKAEVLRASEVDRAMLMALRQRSYADDIWRDIDDVSLHLVAAMGGDYVGYYRLLPWNADGLALSPLHRAYTITPDQWNQQAVLEMGRFCIEPGPHGAAIARRLWLALHGFAREQARPTLVLGLISPNNTNPLVAAAQFEYLRRLAPCERTAGFVPRKRLDTLCGAHRFSPVDIDFGKEPQQAGLPSILRSYLNTGARFGPPVLWRALDNRPAIIASIAPFDVRRRLGAEAG